jgi:transcription termination factor Rho
MYTIDDLNDRLLSELKDIAEGMGVKNAKKLAKQDLIYKILDQQAISGEPKSTKTTEPAERKMRPRKRENVSTENQKPQEKEQTSDEMLQNIDLEVDQSITRFEETNEQEQQPVSEVPKEQREEKPFQQMAW